jgi:hypothetical protein
VGIAQIARETSLTPQTVHRIEDDRAGAELFRLLGLRRLDAAGEQGACVCNWSFCNGSFFRSRTPSLSSKAISKKG